MHWLLGQKLWSRFSAAVEQISGIEPSTLANLLHTVLLLGAYVLLIRLIGRAVLLRVKEPARRYSISKTARYALGLLTCVLIVKIWLLGRIDLTTYFGILTAGLAIALRDPLVNLAGWFFVLWRQPFRVGDRIQLGEHTGDVVDISLLTFTMLEVGNWVEADQSTGRIMHIPNGQVFQLPCANFTEGIQFLWNEIPVTVTFESDWQRAHAILTEIINEVAVAPEDVTLQIRQTEQKYRVYYGHLTPIVWVAVVDVGVQLTIRYLCNSRARRSSADVVWRRVLQAFAEEQSIDFAYPTRRLYNNRQEGKPGTGGPSPEVVADGTVRTASV